MAELPTPKSIDDLFAPENQEELVNLLVNNWGDLPEEIYLKLRRNFNQRTYYFVILYKNGKFVDDEFVDLLISKYGITHYISLKYFPKYFSENVFQQILNELGLTYLVENYAIHFSDIPIMKKYLIEYFDNPQIMGHLFVNNIIKIYFKEYLSESVVNNIKKHFPSFEL